MAYLPVKQALGSTTVSTIVDVSQDPYLSEVICRAGQLSDIEAGRAVKPCANLRDGMTGGIGLRKVVKPLRAYVYAEQHKWVYPVAAAAILGIPFLLGMAMARRT